MALRRKFIRWRRRWRLIRQSMYPGRGSKNLKNGNPCFRQQLDLLRDGAPEVWEDGDRFRFYNSEGRFKGVYQYQEEKHWWKPWKMFDLDPDTFKGAARP